MRRAQLVVIAALLASAAPAIAKPKVIDRIVAVCGDHPILLSELRARAVPLQKQIDARSPDATQRAALEAQLDRDLLEALITERLLAVEADRLKLTVSQAEADAALAQIASANGISVKALFLEAQKQASLDEAAYNAEVRRQILEGKLLQLRVSGKVPSGASEADKMKLLESERRKWIDELKARTFIEVRL